MSTHVAEVVRYRLEKHPNADQLSLAKVKGWQCVVKTSDFKEPVGLAIYIPIEMAVKERPEFEFLRVRKFRIKTIKLRGELSQGLLLPLSILGRSDFREGDDVSELIGAYRYDPTAHARATLKGASCPEPNDGWPKYTDIENWNNWPDVITEGTDVVITEKIHGSNSRLALLPDGQFFVGSHFKAKRYKPYSWLERLKFWWKGRKPAPFSVWANVARDLKIEERMRVVLPLGTILYGEVFGAGIQGGYNYGLTHAVDFRVFDISDMNGHYWPYDMTIAAVEKMGLKMVPILYQGPFEAKRLDLRRGPAFAGTHVREGIVIRPVQETMHPKLGRVILKRINEDYLLKEPEEVAPQETVLEV